MVPGFGGSMENERKAGDENNELINHGVNTPTGWIGRRVGGWFKRD